MKKKLYFVAGLLLISFFSVPTKTYAGVDEKLYSETEALNKSDFNNMAVWFPIFREYDEDRKWGNVGSVKYMWKRSLDGTYPNILTRGRQVLGNNVGDIVVYEFTNKPPYNDGNNGTGVTASGDFWLGYAWAMASGKFQTNKTFYSDDGQISINIQTRKTNDTSRLPKYTITLKREAERNGGNYSNLMFSLYGLQSQYDFYDSSTYKYNGLLGSTDVKLKNKYHLLSETRQTATPLRYDFSGWIKQQSLGVLSSDNLHTGLSGHVEEEDPWKPGQGVTQFVDEKGMSYEANEAIKVGLLKVTGDVNLEVPGVYPVKYTYTYINDLEEEETIETTTDVKVDGTWIESKYSEDEVTLYTGEAFDYNDLVKITDEKGAPVDFNESLHLKNSNLEVKDGVLVSPPGNYQVTFSVALPWKAGSTREITMNLKVVGNSLSLNVPSNINFGSYKLGDPNTTLSWPSDQPIIVDDGRKVKGPWELYAKLIETSNEDYSQCLLMNKKAISDLIPIYVSLGDKEKTIINESWDAQTGIIVEYGAVQEPRVDSGVIEWLLSPSTKEVSE